MNQFLLKCLKLIPLSKLKRYFSFMEISSKSSGNLGSVFIKIKSIHTIKLLLHFHLEKKAKLKTPITTVEPSHFSVFGLNTLIDWVVLTYHPETTGPSNSQDMKKKQFFRS